MGIAVKQFQLSADQSGIHEKYLKGTLGTQEWLSSVDLERMLDSIGLKSQIQIANFTAEEISKQLHEAQKTHLEKNSPYTIPLLLNKGSEDRGSGDHFLAVMIHVDPVNKTINYSVNDSFPISPEEKKEIQATLEAAIQAFPDAIIESNKNKIEGAASLKDAYTNAYCALHNLVNAHELASEVNSNTEAAKFANCAADPFTLVKYVYQEQLKSLIVDEKQIEGPRSKEFTPVAGQDGKRQIAVSKQAAFLKYVGTQLPVEVANADEGDSVVVKHINGYSQSDKTTSFPVIDLEVLSSKHYEDFLLQLHAKLTEHQKTLAKLVLVPCNSIALDGLIACSENLVPLRFDELSLYLPKMSEDEVSGFVLKLKTLLPILSEKGLQKITVTDNENNISEDQWKEIALVLKDKGLACELSLPKAFQKSNVQRDIDQTASTNQFNKILKALTPKTESVNVAVFKNRKKRTRPRVDPTKGLNIDVEQQQQVQAELAVEVKRDNVNEQIKPEVGNLDVIPTWKEAVFLDRFNAGDFNLPAERYLMSRKDCLKMFNTWFGNIQSNEYLLANSAIAGMSAEACKQLLMHAPQFSFGLDFANLPPGFAVVEYPGGSNQRVLHYDKNLLEAPTTNALVPALKEPPQAKPLAYPIFTNLIKKLSESGVPEEAIIAKQWDKLQKAEYDAELAAVFQKHLPAMLALGQEALTALFATDFSMDATRFNLILSHATELKELFVSANPVDSESPAHHLLLRLFPNADAVAQFKNVLSKPSKPVSISLLSILLSDNPELQKEVSAWKDKIPSIKEDALLQVYNERGPSGLTNLFSQWENTDFNILKTLHDTLFCNAKSYMPLLDVEYQEAINVAKGFSESVPDNEWWNALLKAHIAHSGYTDLPALTTSFKQFKQFVTHEKGLSFYSLSSDSFKDVKNMPVALARMVTILRRCSVDDVKNQWKCVSILSLVSDGAVRAITDAQSKNQEYGFVVPEMNVINAHYDIVFGYGPGRAVSAKNIGGKKTIAELKEAFYRRVAAEKKRLPLSFSQEAFSELEKQNFGLEVTAKLAALLVQSTVGDHNEAFIKSAINPLEKWQQILKILTLSDPALPMVVRFAASLTRPSLVNELFQFQVPPPLDVLTRLLDLISNSLMQNGVGAAGALVENCQKLNTLTVLYSNAIYDGMKCYGEEDYKGDTKDSVFYSHISAISEIAYSTASLEDRRAPRRNYLISLISTFQIKASDVDGLFRRLGALNPKIGSDAVDYALKLLRDIAKENNKPRLTLQNFLDLCEELSKLADEKKYKASNEPLVFKPFVEAFLELRMPSYFPNNYFEKLRSVGIEPSILKLIAELFGEHDQSKIHALIERFSKPGENEHYPALIKNIARITSSMSIADKDVFLQNLQRDELFLADNGRKIEIQTFLQLIDAITERGHANDFIYLLAQDKSKGAKGLTAKAVLYLTKILPNIGKNTNDTVSKIDILPLVSEILLGSSPDSLAAKIEVKRADQNHLDALSVVLQTALNAVNNGKIIDLKELETAIKNFKDVNSHKFEALNSLFNQIEELNKPKPFSITGMLTGVANAAKGLWNGLLSRVGYGSAESEQSASPLISKEFLENASQEINVEQERRKEYLGVFSDSFQSISQIVEKYPGTKSLIIDFVTQFVKGYDSNSGSLIEKAWDCINTIHQEFIAINDPDTVRSLCFHYSGVEGDLKPANLLSLIQDPNFARLDNDARKLMLQIAAALLNNDKAYTLPEFLELIAFCNDAEEGKIFIAHLQDVYKTAPYPSISQIKQWHLEAKATANYDRAFKKNYTAFDSEPCERECYEEQDKLKGKKTGNGFILDQANTKRKHFHGVSFSEDELDELEIETVRVRESSTEDLIKEFKTFRQHHASQSVAYVKLVAIAAEILYRCKGQEGSLGSSFEINTTQYLAILGALKSGSHITSEIGTGEGKSRIMGILNACKYGLGKTVDFVTSDVLLATRDYLEYQPYFSMLGAQTNIISSESPFSDYRKDGINYSDAANLSLFRNKARSVGMGDEVIATDPTARALMLDEADKTYFDAADTRYNFSTEADESLNGMEWIYPLLVEFFHSDPDKAREEAYFEDVDDCNQKFAAFITTTATKEQIAKFKTLSQGQIETWLDAAHTARALQLDKHFSIETDITINTPYGPKIASEAKLIVDGLKSANSKFSFGVHQCLHAHLNMLKQHPDRARPGEERVLDKIAGKQNFNIEVEKQIIYSSGSKNLLDDYQVGNLVAVTGTAGSIIEQQEASNLYGGMKFVSVPRHNGLNRVDKAVRLTKGSDAQIKALVDYILECMRNNQPALVICEDDKKSKVMYDALSRALIAKGIDSQLIQPINNDMTMAQQNEAIKKAGKAGMVTVSTGMIGRGTDIKLDKDAKEKGLEVLATYLPSERDMKQIFGRSGRAGDNGGARLVLNKAELKEKLGKASLKDGFYTSTETYLRQQQALMDRNKQCMRLIANTKNDFDKQRTDNFFDDFLAKVSVGQRKELAGIWMAYVKEKDQIWDGLKKELIAAIDKVNPSPDSINSYLTQYQTKTQALWKELCRKAGEMDLQHVENPLVKPVSLLHEDVGGLQLDKQTKALITSFNLKKAAPHTIKVYDRYDPAHDGRAVLYTRSFEKFRAFLQGERNLFADFLAWKNGHGILFPYLRAWWNGDMSFKHFLLGKGTSKPEDSGTEMKKAPESIVGSYDAVFKKKGFLDQASSNDRVNSNLGNKAPDSSKRSISKNANLPSETTLKVDEDEKKEGNRPSRL